MQVHIYYVEYFKTYDNYIGYSTLNIPRLYIPRLDIQRQSFLASLTCGAREAFLSVTGLLSM